MAIILADLEQKRWKFRFLCTYVCATAGISSKYSTQVKLVYFVRVEHKKINLTIPPIDYIVYICRTT